MGGSTTPGMSGGLLFGKSSTHRFAGTSNSLASFDSGHGSKSLRDLHFLCGYLRPTCKNQLKYYGQKMTSLRICHTRRIWLMSSRVKSVLRGRRWKKGDIQGITP